MQYLGVCIMLALHVPPLLLYKIWIDCLFCTLQRVTLGNTRYNAVCISILRKSQAQKFNSSIEDFEKQKSQTVKVLRDAIAEMKTYIDKELETVSKF